MELNAMLSEELKGLFLPTIRSRFEQEAVMARKESLSYEQYLWELVRQESESRKNNKIKRLLRSSKLPLEKCLDTFDQQRLPIKIRRQLKVLLDGSFIKRQENILVFGAPGSGKTHLLCAIGQHLIRQGFNVQFATCSLLAQELLAAKRDLRLEKLLKKLRRIDALIIDDIGYVRQNREEMEVLFTLLADRYERASVMLTSNLPFSKWEQIFKDPMTTAAAIDRLAHHSIILELNLKSYRMEHAQNRKGNKS